MRGYNLKCLIRLQPTLITIAIHREAIANMPGYPNFDPFRPLTQIIYIDANNLYGKAMTHSLPNADLQEDMKHCLPVKAEGLSTAHSAPATHYSSPPQFVHISWCICEPPKAALGFDGECT